MSNQSVIPGDIDALSRQFDEGRHLRLGGWLVLLGFGGFLLWGLLAPLDKGVPVSGSVVVAGNRKAVQHPSGGVVSQIQVHEGDRVRAGQVLLLMDTVDSRTQRDALRSQQLSNAAQRARLQAGPGTVTVLLPPGNPLVQRRCGLRFAGEWAGGIETLRLRIAKDGVETCEVRHYRWAHLQAFAEERGGRIKACHRFSPLDK